MKNIDNQLLLKKHIDLTFGDQKGQLDFLINCFFNYEANGLPKNGFFIDLACADGVTINNTYFLERYLGWSGILFEPNPGFHASIHEFRTSPLVTDCVADRAGEMVPFRLDNGMLGGIVSDHTDNNLQLRHEELSTADISEIATTTLENELRRFQSPPVIDFMSLDVEGAEHLILRDFPFNKYRFRSLVIERPTKELDILLDSVGYCQVSHLAYDVFYAHRSELENINFSPRCRFAFTPRKAF